MAERGLYTLITIQLNKCYHSDIDKKAVDTQKTDKMLRRYVSKEVLSEEMWRVWWVGRRENIYGKVQRHEKVCHIWGRIHLQSWIIRCLGYKRIFTN